MPGARPATTPGPPPPAGLGRKSVACIVLLTLHGKEFPVDVNVGRIAARCAPVCVCVGVEGGWEVVMVVEEEGGEWLVMDIEEEGVVVCLLRRKKGEPAERGGAGDRFCLSAFLTARLGLSADWRRAASCLPNDRAHKQVLHRRLGWIPLDAEDAVEELDDYAPEPEVHKYLHSRWAWSGRTHAVQAPAAPAGCALAQNWGAPAGAGGGPAGCVV